LAPRAIDGSPFCCLFSLLRDLNLLKGLISFSEDRSSHSPGLYRGQRSFGMSLSGKMMDVHRMLKAKWKQKKNGKEKNNIPT